MGELDFEGEIETTELSDEELKGLSELLKYRGDLEKEIEKLDEEKKKLEGHLLHLERETIPARMDELGVSCYFLRDGTKIEVLDEVTAKIPAKNKLAAYNWLRENGAGDLIKNEVVAKFGRGEDEKAAGLREKLEAAGFVTDQQENIHWSTLRAFVREQVEAGVDLPDELLGVFRFRKVKVSP